MSARETYTVRRLEAGFSMVELMIAIALSLVVTLAVISVFAGSRAAYRSTSGVAGLTDGGRFALNFIQQSARIAGYVACTEAPGQNESTANNQTIVLNTGQDVLANAVGTLAYDFRAGVDGFEASGTGPAAGAVTVSATPTVDGNNGDWAPLIDPAFTSGTTTQVKGSDVVAFRESTGVTPAYLVGAAIVPGTPVTTLQVNNTAGLQVGQIAAISNCALAVPFQITGITPGQPGTVSFSGSAGVGPGNTGTPLELPFMPGALIMPLTTVVYYIGVGADGDSALKRLDLNGANGPGVFTDEEIVPDIENMQVLYGVDTNLSLTPGEYVTADAVPDFDQVVSIEVAVLAASPPGSSSGPPIAGRTYNLLGTTVTAPTDNRIRQVFQMTIALRNSVN